MISKWRIASLIGLCIVSTLTCGFSSWIYVVNNKADVGDIDVNVGNITTNSTATIVFQNAKLFSFNKYGFAHEEEITVDNHNNKQTITYFDYSYSISSLWRVSTKDTRNFKYEIDEEYSGFCNFLPSSGTLTVSSYSTYNESTGALSDALGEARSSYNSSYFDSKSGSITYTLELPHSVSYQYVMLEYKNKAAIEKDSSFEATVFTPATTQVDSTHKPPQQQIVTFSFLLNKKVGA